MSFVLFVIISAICLLIFGIVILSIARKSKQNTLLPHGKIVYDDLHSSPPSVYSQRYPLVGKPDLILKKGWKRIPVEVKSGNHHTPKPHHVMQLMSYCQLAKEVYHRPSPYGYLLYSDTNKRFKILFNHVQKNQLKSTINLMKETVNTGKVVRNHNDKRKCKGCKFKPVCFAKIQ
jgi:CRISPR-associated exonuclease Cas4